MSIPDKFVIPSFIFFLLSTYSLYRLLTPFIVIFPVLNMGKIFLWTSHVSYQLSCDICGGIVVRHSGLVCGHNGTLAGEATLGVTVAADRSGRFKSAV